MESLKKGKENFRQFLVKVIIMKVSLPQILSCDLAHI